MVCEFRFHNYLEVRFEYLLDGVICWQKKENRRAYPSFLSIWIRLQVEHRWSRKKKILRRQGLCFAYFSSFTVNYYKSVSAYNRCNLSIHIVVANIRYFSFGSKAVCQLHVISIDLDDAVAYTPTIIRYPVGRCSRPCRRIF